MNKKDILNKIKSLEGLNQDERAYLVNLVNTKKKYGLVWEDKPEDVEEELRTKLPVLQEVKERAIVNDTEEQQNPNHILIEGDNLHALTALTFTHENKIDLIYIDPPYNTGKKDFIYNDHYVDKEDAYRHSKWISFMEKRLRIAHKMLKDDGVIFISIDENECHNLKVLLDEIFGENNFVEQIIWNKRIPKNDKGIGNIHESVLLYAKRYSSQHIFSQKKDGIEDVNEFVKSLKRKKLKIELAEKEIKKFFKKNDYDRGITLYNSFDSDYKLWGKINVSWPNAKTVGPRYDVLHPKTLKPAKVPDRGWRFTKDTFEEMLDYNNVVERYDGSFVCGKVWFAKDENTQPSTIKYLEDVNSFLLRSIISTKSDGSNELLEILGESKFDYPKPTDLINRLIDSVDSKDLVVLDFFAGSGTTLHTLLNLNSEDNGSRQGIIVTNNENNIAKEVTYERNKRVIEGFTSTKGEQIEGLKNNNLRYYKTAFVDREPSLSNKRQLTQLATELLCIKEDCYLEITSALEKESWHKLFTNNQGKYVYVVYDDMYIEEAIEALTAFVTSQAIESTIKVYVFANGQYAYHEEFEVIADNITLAALPDAIYKAYQNVLPKENKEFVPVLEDDILENE
ncbi:site-specific DNA-methyltransferase [Algibacter luteus]|uniref:site-specific DNA-methyltransferase n=1 Tax=Algibacter luteus TaxID=1178825 RepID=UPI0025968439|nr:site-specific DNA-methyltransferase [Algibacter luteus]WJJ95738.1 site-specific DNA-methyltransferase [Algibacter luteus]